MQQEGQVTHFLNGWTEEVAGRGLAGARAGQAEREVYLVAWAAHDGGEDGAGRVIPREASLH